MVKTGMIISNLL